MSQLDEEQLSRWHRGGWLLLPRFFESELVAAARAQAFDIFPTSAEFVTSPEKFAYLRFSQFAAMRTFPFPGVQLSLICVHEHLLSLVERLLDCRNPLVYQAQLWAKYQGAVAYEQTHHRDYAKNTMLVPTAQCASDFAELFVFLSDVADEDGPTALVPLDLTKHLPLEPARYSRTEMPALYHREIIAAAPAGSVLVYRGDVFHRATEITRPGGTRLGLKLAYKRREATWVTYYEGLRVGFEPDWSRFVRGATARQLEAVGFPSPADNRWNDPDVISDLDRRYNQAH